MASVSDPEDIKQALVVRADLQMGKGKIAAQVAHASIDAYIKASKKSPGIASHWLASGMPKSALKVQSEEELVIIFQKAKDAGLPCALISDAGKTQIAPGTKTCVGIGPAKAGEIDKISGELPLL